MAIFLTAVTLIIWFVAWALDLKPVVLKGDKPVSNCSRRMRDEGFPAPRTCELCETGPCWYEGIGPYRAEAKHSARTILYLAPHLPPLVVPNRLYGTTINENGEAI